MSNYLSLSFNIKKLGTVNEGSKNFFRTAPPYYLLNHGNADTIRDMVVVFGNDYRKLTPSIDVEEFIRTYNKCLDFVRKECAGCRLYFRPHPTSTDDINLYDLSSFEILKDGLTGETFLYKNLNQIKCVFSLGSTALLMAHSLGLNSYAFSKLFKSSFNASLFLYYENFLGGMPDSFFISDLNQNLQENRIPLKTSRENLFELHLANVLDKNRGTVWFITVDPGILLLQFALVRLIKNISPERRVGLIVVGHERWGSVDKNELRSYFNDLSFFPKVDYSLKPLNLFNALKTFREVKKFRIEAGDILCGVGPGSFLENCFISYFKNNFKIALTTDQIFDFTHKFESKPDLSDIKIKPATIVFNNIIEPLLGLHREVRIIRPSGKNGGHLTRYREGIDKIFDAVYVFKIK